MADGIFQRKEDGLYVGKIVSRGKPYQKTSKQKKVVREWLIATRAALQAGSQVDAGRLTVSDYCQKWLAGKRNGIQPTTFAVYATLLRLHVLPTIGSVQLSRLTPADLRATYASLESKLVSSSIRKCHRLVHKFLKDAVRDGTLSKNVADAVEVRVPAQEKKPILSVAETAHVLAVAKGDRHEALFCLLAGTGMRLGEALGLKWSDLDLDGQRPTYLPLPSAHQRWQ